MITKDQCIEYLQEIQKMLIEKHYQENGYDIDNEYCECQEAEEIQNTIYILESLEGIE